MPIDPAILHPRRILVRGVNWLGDAVMTTPAQNLMSVRYDGAARRLLGLTRSGDVYSTNDGQTWNRTAVAGVHIRSLSVAGGRLLGITPFRGIVAQPESQAQALRAASAGSSK